jgi:C-terminal processing protease CtpA/Prc
MKKYIIIILCLVLGLAIIVFIANQSKKSTPNISANNDDNFTAKQYKADYLQACKLIANNYIYLEKKLNISKKQFLKKCTKHADKIKWDKEIFIREIRNLRAKFPDGHFDWSLSRKCSLRNNIYFLGIVLTAKNSNKVFIERVYPHFTDKLNKGDEILKWNGKPIMQVINEMGKLYPQSTKCSTDEIAARHLTISFPSKPLRDKLNPIDITYKTTLGKIKETTLNWEVTSNISSKTKYYIEPKSKKNNIVHITHNVFLSLEDIPVNSKYINPDLIYYFITIDSKKIAVLHPRDFNSWNAEDIDKTMGLIMNEKPFLLVVDLKDTAGGNFAPVLCLSFALNVKRSFSFNYEYIISKTGKRISGTDNADSFTDKIKINNSWIGSVLFRINPVCGSGGDFFARWMQLNQRGKFFGEPTAGRGGGYDDFTLKNTKITISFPLRERIISGDTKSIEGNSVMPDYKFEGTITQFLESGKDKEISKLLGF